MKLILSADSTEIDFRAVSTEIECGFYHVHVHDHGYAYGGFTKRRTWPNLAEPGRTWGRICCAHTGIKHNELCAGYRTPDLLYVPTFIAICPLRV